MILTLATIALLSVPFALDVYFNSPSDSDSVEDEYVPDGR